MTSLVKQKLLEPLGSPKSEKQPKEIDPSTLDQETYELCRNETYEKEQIFAEPKIFEDCIFGVNCEFVGVYYIFKHCVFGKCCKFTCHVIDAESTLLLKTRFDDCSFGDGCYFARSAKFYRCKIGRAHAISMMPIKLCFNYVEVGHMSTFQLSNGFVLAHNCIFGEHTRWKCLKVDFEKCTFEFGNRFITKHLIDQYLLTQTFENVNFEDCEFKEPEIFVLEQDKDHLKPMVTLYDAMRRVKDFPLDNMEKFKVGQYCLKNQDNESLEDQEFGTSEETQRKDFYTIPEIEEKITKTLENVKSQENQTLTSAKELNDGELISNKNENNETIEEFDAKKDVAHGALYRKLRRNIAEAYYGDGLAYHTKQYFKKLVLPNKVRYENMAADIEKFSMEHLDLSHAEIAGYLANKREEIHETQSSGNMESFPLTDADSLIVEEEKKPTVQKFGSLGSLPLGSFPALDGDSIANKKIDLLTAEEKENSKQKLENLTLPSFPTLNTDATVEKRNFAEYASLNHNKKAKKKLWKMKADQSKREVEALHQRLENDISKIKTSKFAKSDKDFLKKN